LFVLQRIDFMKKTLLLLAIALSVLPIFASKNNLYVKLAPYAFQIATSEKEGDDPLLSTYGIGADISYERNLEGGFYAEGGLSWNTYTLEDKEPLSSIMPYVGIGYDFVLGEKWNVTADFALGVDSLIYDGIVAPSFTIKTGLAAGVKVSEKLSATMGCDATFGFCEKDGTSYVNYRIVPTLGLEVAF